MSRERSSAAGLPIGAARHGRAHSHPWAIADEVGVGDREVSPPDEVTDEAGGSWGTHVFPHGAAGGERSAWEVRGSIKRSRAVSSEPSRSVSCVETTSVFDARRAQLSSRLGPWPSRANTARREQLGSGRSARQNASRCASPRERADAFVRLPRDQTASMSIPIRSRRSGSVEAAVDLEISSA